MEYAKKHNQFMNQWTPQTKINGGNKFPGLVNRGTNGTINSHDMNFNMVTLGNGMMTVSGDKNSKSVLKAQMMNLGKMIGGDLQVPGNLFSTQDTL